MKRTPQTSPWRQVSAWMVCLVFLLACTRQVARPPVETRHFELDWESLHPQRIEWREWLVEAVPLTPSQWPLEASLKNLLAADFEGVIDHFDLRFHSSTLDGELLQELFDAGFLPVYLRVTRQGETAETFMPEFFKLEADGDKLFFPVPANDLPRQFKEVDWSRMGSAVVVTVLTLALIVLAAREGRGAGFRTTGRLSNITLRAGTSRRYRSAPRAAPVLPSDPGILRQTELAPGESMEGFLFFRLDQDVTDWTSVRLAVP